ncbi:4'-phosphopantetheinyl transferase superfamily protein [Kitasatospora sp. GAS1066B]|uniref:4'-phosphopantetheinyl transferase family protein n=1 Tax=Kitasatospora sp. GAS1066B TaxID=3156271 RepID=UPI003513C953
MEPGQVEVRWVAVTPASAAVAEAAAGGVLDEQERRRSTAFRRAEDRALYQVAHVALRRLLAERLGRRPEEVTFRRASCPGCGEPHGRPEQAHDPGLEFSLSHAAGLALIALAADPVGADVELGGAFEPGAGAEVVTQLHPAEQAELAALAELRPERWAAGALRCWVRKEAYLKGTGMGLGQGADKDYVGLGPGFEVPAAGGARPPAGWELRAVDVPSGYDAAIALRLPRGLAGEAVLVRSAELRLAQ